MNAPTEKHDESSLVIADSIVWNVKIETPDTRGRTGTTFQAGKSHTHPGHPIHPTTNSETWTTLLAYLKSLVWAVENN